MKDGSFLRRRLSLGPATSTPQKSDPQKLSRNLLFGGENDLFPLSPGKDVEGHNPLVLQDEEAQTPVSISKTQQMDYRFCNGTDRAKATPAPEVARKERLKVQKHNYRQEKKRVSKQLVSALRDPSVVIMADWLKIRGALKSWCRLWCVLKPGALLLYKTPKMDHWVGTVLLHSCELIERPSKKDGVCFKLFHPLDQSIWAVKGPEGENVGSITQPLPGSHLIFRASESDGHCWLDALELALCCSGLFRLSTAKNGKDGEPNGAGDPAQAPLNGLLLTSNHELFQPSDAALEDGGLSDRWEREPDEESENGGPGGDRKAGESEQAETPEEQGSAGSTATTYVEQAHEEMGEPGGSSQTETVSEENKGLMWALLKQLRPGMDLSRVVLPTFVLEPRSFLNKLSDYYYHADLLSRAAQEEDHYRRLKHVLRWYLSGFYKKPKGIKKPYNPILGETFRCRWYHPQTNSHTFYIAEQVSHHPPVSAFHVSNRKDGFCVGGSVLAKSRFYGNSLSALLDGQATLTFLRQEEEYIITMPHPVRNHDHGARGQGDHQLRKEQLPGRAGIQTQALLRRRLEPQSNLREDQVRRRGAGHPLRPLGWGSTDPGPDRRDHRRFLESDRSGPEAEAEAPHRAVGGAGGAGVREAVATRVQCHPQGRPGDGHAGETGAGGGSAQQGPGRRRLRGGLEASTLLPRFFAPVALQI
ncbi:oxysterol-binding protein-related protein 5 isoform X4 [Tachyglossus aculeatus]|uniref:oxysterol-binding protein-related protein 5 isoform X4 n=1 Tax=Tachyglossus aculeatus TaxID=9261 RepID=UPI0018F5E46E|nr:oxysterol-binding protein-related protein 5 isoform X4 [Tachyglossus aculeatus]